MSTKSLLHSRSAAVRVTLGPARARFPFASTTAPASAAAAGRHRRPCLLSRFDPRDSGLPRSAPGEVPVHLTMPPDRVERARAILEGVKGVSIHVCDNRGRDIWPFVWLLGTGALDG